MDRAGNEEESPDPDLLRSSATHDLLLLMAGLAQIDDPHLIEKRFIETLNRVFAPLTIEKVETEDAGAGPWVEIATARRSFGGMVVRSRGGGADERTLALLRNAARTVAVILENTERRQAEEALRQSEERFSRVFMFSPAAMAITRAEDGLYYDVNTKWLSALGYARDEVIGKTAVELGVWDDLEQRSAFIGWARREGALHGFETVFVTKDGRRRTIVLAAETLEIAGEPCLLGAFYDITDRKDTERALRESEARLRAVFDNTPGVPQPQGCRRPLPSAQQALRGVAGVPGGRGRRQDGSRVSAGRRRGGKSRCRRKAGPRNRRGLLPRGPCAAGQAASSPDSHQVSGQGGGRRHHFHRDGGPRHHRPDQGGGGLAGQRGALPPALRGIAAALSVAGRDGPNRRGESGLARPLRVSAGRGYRPLVRRIPGGGTASGFREELRPLHRGRRDPRPPSTKWPAGMERSGR